MSNNNASWTTPDETALLNFLNTQAAAAADGGTFKMVTFNAAPIVVDAIRTKGGRKTAKACQNKWAAIHLKKSFRAIQAIKGRSGWTWSDETGASITPDMEDAWRDFLLIHKDAKPFKNKGWVHLEKMTMLMPTTVRGTYVFRPSQGISGMDPFQDDDDSLPPGILETQEEHNVEEEEATQHEEAAPVPLIPSTPPRAARKRERAVSETPARTVKKAKMTTADAMAGLNTAIDRFGNSMCKALAGDPSEKTPHHHTKAVKHAQKEYWLDKKDRLILCKVLESNIKAADAYLALDPDDIEFCELWMEDKVREVKALTASS
ncbi:hypothetical protein GALMADRAFT_213445 [Galerina marginata CBS 339.88]|uniref:Myb/SANT-like domain-containing protein n=1 Tax=Galerina marginata (strain CBS 339.88) TaxID=685588 RepID=A0A067SM56_GALM3|nr:hypothetical protein GALMADRAFT_213445 [Galerina marginata CBS 339.88]